MYNVLRLIPFYFCTINYLFIY